MRYAGSLGSLGTPHPNLDFMLRNIGRSDLLEKRIIQVLDWSTLCSRYQVRKVDVVQLDCEGKDCAILRGMLNYCDRKPLALPRILQFEANHLTPEEEILDTLQSLAQRGFTLRYRTTNNIMVERFYDTTASESAPASATASCHTTQGREEMQGRHEQGHQQPPQSCVGKYYDFIEVGTADWGTLTHYCAKDTHSASPAGEEIWSSLDDLPWVRGIAVDPSSEHLQALPDLPQVQKVEAAMDEWSGQDNFWYVGAAGRTWRRCECWCGCPARSAMLRCFECGRHICAGWCVQLVRPGRRTRCHICCQGGRPNGEA